MITAITAYRDCIHIEGAKEGQYVEARTPVVSGVEELKGEIVWSGRVENGRIPRYCASRDLLVCKFSVENETGVRFVTETCMEPTGPRFTPKSLKGVTSCTVTDEDAEYLGVGQTLAEHNQAMLMTTDGGERVVAHVYDGKTYYFRQDVLDQIESNLTRLKKLGISHVMRYINSSYIANEKADKALVKIIEHPGYDAPYPSAYVGAFNLRTEEGTAYFCACTDFLLSRYAATFEHGIVTGFEMGNEVTSQYIWQNAGEMDCAQFIREYTSVMRIAWQMARKYSDSFKIYASFDQHFCGRFVEHQPRRFYGMKECIENIQKYCEQEGDFGWNVSYHPYPESLSYPDFWNDREPVWSFETRRITFKNVEVMPQFLAQERFLYKGELRRVILPEEGFNSREGEEYTLLQGAHGYCLAYLKIRALPNIDGFIHHSYMDNLWEFGLNLGLVYNDGHDHPAGRKPICDVMHDMDTPAENARIQAARAYIGEEQFERVLHPPVVVEKRDHSKDGFRMGKGETQENQEQNFDS